jgi:fatty-acyl-CoA synthase
MAASFSTSTSKYVKLAGVGMTTAADLLLDRADDDSPALLHDDRCWSYRELVAEALRRHALFTELHDPARPPHVGVLLDNVPDYLFWLAAAALGRAVVVGINSTYRGEPLAQLVAHTDCELLVTSSVHEALLHGIDHGVPDDRVLVVDQPGYDDALGRAGAAASLPTVAGDDLYLLIFTSGSTGLPKAVRCTQGRFARTGTHVASIAGLSEGDVTYAPLPLFHSSSLFTGWAGALAAGTALATRTRFSASNTLPDIRRFGATVMTYTGKVLNYLLVVPEAEDDGESPLRLAVGNEASRRDIEEFATRFTCAVRDSYGSTEGVIVIRRHEGMPQEALGRSDESVRVIDPDTGEECPRAVLGADGRIVNLEAAIGEIVETEPVGRFEGYYKNEAATHARFLRGWYWSGDLAYRDADGWLYFAGRSNEWLRVDGENFAAGPVEAIVLRNPSVRAATVYAVPDDPVGDRVMVAIEVAGDAPFDPRRFDAFLREQPDLGPKWVPAFVRVATELPKLASMKLDKTGLRREAWQAGDVYWRPAKGEALRPLTDADRHAIDHLLG